MILGGRNVQIAHCQAGLTRSLSVPVCPSPSREASAGSVPGQLSHILTHGQKSSRAKAGGREEEAGTPSSPALIATSGQRLS